MKKLRKKERKEGRRRERRREMPIGDYLTSDNGGRMNGAELAKSNCYVHDNHKDTCFKRRSSQHGTRLAFKAISRIPSPLSKRQAKDKKHNKKKNQQAATMETIPE